MKMEEESGSRNRKCKNGTGYNTRLAQLRI